MRASTPSPRRAFRTPAAVALAFLLVVPVTAAADPEPANLALWEVTHDGRTLYLMGSVHLLHPDVYPLDEALYQAFDRAELVAFELDFDEMMEALPMMMERATFRDGQTLRDVLPAETWVELENKTTALGAPVEVFTAMQPWMAAISLTSIALELAGYEAAAGIDLHFHERAVRAGKRIVGLETVEDQVDAFVGGGMEGQIALLKSTLDQLDMTVEVMNESTELWRRGEAERLAELLYDSMGEYPDLMERLLYERNRNWMPAIEAMLATPETAIVIVGVGHLVGPGSVVELLSARGYEVVQLQSAPAEKAR